MSQDVQTGGATMRDYIAAILQEHKCARDEILQRLTSRNYIIGLLTDLLVTLHAQAIGKLLPLPADGDPIGWTWFTLVLLPACWFALAAYLISNMRQVDRAAIFVCYLEAKLAEIFAANSEDSLVRTRNSLGGVFRNERGFDLTQPIIWERLLRDGRAPEKCENRRDQTEGIPIAESAKGRPRWWDSYGKRTWPILLGATVFSVCDAALAVFLGDFAPYAFGAATAVIVLFALLCWRLLSRPEAFRQLLIPGDLRLDRTRLGRQPIVPLRAPIPPLESEPGA